MTLDLRAFPGGVHPRDGKALSSGCPVETAPLLATYVVPLLQHIGVPARPVVKKGDSVRRGQVLAAADGFVSAAVHAPTSGTVRSIGECMGPAGVPLAAFELAADGADAPDSGLPPIADWEGQPADTLRQRLQAAGIVGMGGAAFPTHVKLSPPPARKIDTLILNGVECEPFLTADHRLLLEPDTSIVTGARIAAHILGVTRILLAIERNKPDAIELMTAACADTGIQVQGLDVRYPQGGERQLIYALTGRKVPTAGLPMDVGCVVLNVGTAAAIAEAVIEGKSLYERIVTLTGTPLVRPGNWRVRVGTSLADLLRMAGGVARDPAKILFGGPMMGLSVYSLEVPVMKNTTGILLLAPEEIDQFTSEPCIRCGRCLQACPMRLNPSLLGVQIEAERFDLADQNHVMDCIECGCCAYVCPAHRPLVQHFRRAKMEIAALRRAAARR